MTNQNDLLAVLKFFGTRDNLVKVDYDFDRTYPKPFSIPEHYQAFIIGSFCLGMCIIMIYFIR